MFRIVLIISCVAFFGGALGLQVRQVPGRQCSADGQIINDGDMFTLAMTGPCIKYLCKDGEIHPGEYGCERDGSCHPVGDTYNIGCIQRRCQAVNGWFDYVRVTEGCSYKDICLKVDEIYQDGCFRYKCIKGGNELSATYSVTLDDWGCLNGGSCYPENHTLTISCRTLKCEMINGVVGFRSIEDGCPFGALCLKIGERTVDTCRTYECRKTDLNGTPYFSVDPIAARCQDANMDCKDPGTYFDFEMGGTVRQNCTCHVESSLSVQYFC